MKLSQAIDYHSNIPLGGLLSDGTWREEVVYGAFLAFDRFITERSFGQKKRIFQTNSRGPIPDEYTVVRTPDGRAYLVTAHNADIGGIEAQTYNNIYLLQEAPHTADIITFTTVPTASGLGGQAVRVVDATVHCDMDRYGGARSSEFDTVTYTTSLVVFPEGTPINTDNELTISGINYDVLEVWTSLKTVVAKVNKRSSSV